MKCILCNQVVICPIEKEKLRRKRIGSSLRIAKAAGKSVGRKKTRNDGLIYSLRKRGYSLREICEELNISLGSVQASLRERRRKEADENM